MPNSQEKGCLLGASVLGESIGLEALVIALLYTHFWLPWACSGALGQDGSLYDTPTLSCLYLIVEMTMNRLAWQGLGCKVRRFPALYSDKSTVLGPLPIARKCTDGDSAPCLLARLQMQVPISKLGTVASGQYLSTKAGHVPAWTRGASPFLSRSLTMHNPLLRHAATGFARLLLVSYLSFAGFAPFPLVCLSRLCISFIGRRIKRLPLALASRSR